MNNSYALVVRLPTVEEYNRVRHCAGLAVKSEVAAEKGLVNSLYSVCVEYRGELVGMGRVIGDGGLFYEIVDIAVAAEHHGKGIGRMIMNAIMTYLDAKAPPTSLISLLSNRGVSAFYEKFGLQVRDPAMPAMQLRK